jgi:hypothetical protein
MYMSQDARPGATPSDAAARIQRWATALCHAATLRSADVADALELDLATADRLGCQRIFPPSTVDSRVEFVTGPDEQSIIFLEVTPSDQLTAADLSTLLGPWREVSSGPHADAPTLLFQDLWPENAERGCSIALRVKAGWPEIDAGSTVVLYPQSTRSM